MNSTYINSTNLDRCSVYDTPVNWELFTDQRLAWLYGDGHAAKRRAATQADLAAWRNLGKGRAAA